MKKHFKASKVEHLKDLKLGGFQTGFNLLGTFLTETEKSATFFHCFHCKIYENRYQNSNTLIKLYIYNTKLAAPVRLFLFNVNIKNV